MNYRKFIPVSIVLLTCAIYIPALKCGFIWDDSAHVTRPELRSLSGLGRIWFDLGATQQYYPFLHSAFWLEQQIFDEHAWAYHLVNVLEHAANACLVYFILRLLQIPGAYLASLLFALHPVQVESVAWISEQKNTLSALFYLSAMLTYLKFDPSRQPKLYALASLLFLLGLLTKTVTATLPAALLVIFWWQRGKLSWRVDVRPLVPWFAMGIVAGLSTAWIERKLIGAEGTMFNLSVLQRLLLAGRVICFYLGKLIWPSNFVFIYPRWTIDPTIWWQWSFIIAVFLTTVLLWLWRRRARGPLACWLFFAGTLFPVLGFVNVFPFIYSFVADHFQYLASLGIFVLFAGVVTWSVRGLQLTGKRIALTMCAGAVAFLATITWRQISTYSNNLVLFERTIEANPSCWMAHNNLGLELMAYGELEKATKHFQDSLQLNPENRTALVNMGLAMEKSGRPGEATRWYEAAIQAHPNFFFAHYQLGHLLMITGHPQEAIKSFCNAIRLKPEYPFSYFDCGYALAQIGENEQAMLQFKATLQLQPNHVDAHYNLAFLLAATGQIDEAVSHYREAVRLKPDFPEAHFNWANAVAHDRPDEAIYHYQKAIELRPEYAEAYANLASTYAQVGDWPKAVLSMEKAIEIAKNANNQALLNQWEPLLQSYKNH